MASLYDRLKAAKPVTSSGKTDQNIKSLLELEHSMPVIEDVPASLFAETLGFLSKGLLSFDCSIEDVLFLDTETTGLSGGAGTLAFLVGLGQFINRRMQVTQLMIRDYHQEAQLLHLVEQRVKGAKLLVTYNGASFDIPLLDSRMTMNRIRSSITGKPHLDLLHAARRVFKLRLGRCPLSRMEEAVLGFTRQDDLPGSQVPARFFAYLKTRQEDLLTEVLEHNQLDIHSLSRLLLVLADLHQRPHSTNHQADLFSLGKVFETRGETQRAISCYRACSEQSVRQLAQMQLAELYRKNRMDREAAEVFEGLRLLPAASARVFIGLAKVYEHRYRDPQRALEITKQGMLYCSERPGFQADNDLEYLDLHRRSLRLIRKAERNKR